MFGHGMDNNESSGSKEEVPSMRKENEMNRKEKTTGGNWYNTSEEETKGERFNQHGAYRIN